jgi:hypothetical protein
MKELKETIHPSLEKTIKKTVYLIQIAIKIIKFIEKKIQIGIFAKKLMEMK